MTKQEIQAQTTKALKALVASTNPEGKFFNEVRWAKAELNRRRDFGLPVARRTAYL